MLLLLLLVFVCCLLFVLFLVVACCFCWLMFQVQLEVALKQVGSSWLISTASELHTVKFLNFEKNSKLKKIIVNHNSTNEHIPKKKKNDAVKVLEEEDVPIINNFLIDSTTINRYKNKASLI